jgi:hypothetical protein
VARGLRDPAGCLPGHEVDGGGKEAKHALLPAATLEGADRVGIGGRFLGALLGGTIGEQHQPANHLVASLGPIHKAQQQLCKRRGQFHGRPFHPPCSRESYVTHRSEAVIQEGTTVCALRGTPHGIRSASMRTGVKDVGMTTDLCLMPCLAAV